MNLKEVLLKLDFHDSKIEQIKFESRKCILIIDYYNWEGNKSGIKPWKKKKLKIVYNHLLHFEFSAPDIINSVVWVYEAVFDNQLSFYQTMYFNEKKKYPKMKPLFEENQDFLSIKFNTTNFGDEEQGYLLFIGTNASIEWI